MRPWTIAEFNAFDAYAKKRKAQHGADRQFDGDMAVAERAQALKRKPTPARIAGSLYPLVQLCIFGGLPTPVPEFAWHPQRRYRADYALVEAKILIEIDGGLFVNGGHSRGAARIHDMAKDRAATKLGWRTLRYPQSSDVWAEIIADLRDMLL